MKRANPRQDESKQENIIGGDIRMSRMMAVIRKHQRFCQYLPVICVPFYEDKLQRLSDSMLIIKKKRKKKKPPT